MQKFLFYGSYTPEGYQGLLAEGGSARIGAAKQALQSVGGNIGSFLLLQWRARLLYHR
jgi:uncharacterized protein with GYD domain